MRNSNRERRKWGGQEREAERQRQTEFSKQDKVAGNMRMDI